MHLGGKIASMLPPHYIAPATSGDETADAVNGEPGQRRQREHIQHAAKGQASDSSVNEHADRSRAEHAEQAYAQTMVHRLARQHVVHGHDHGDYRAAEDAHNDRNRDNQVNVRAKNHAVKIAAMKIRPNGVTHAVLSKWEYMAKPYQVSRTKAYAISPATVSWCSAATRSKTVESSMYMDSSSTCLRTTFSQARFVFCASFNGG